MKKEIKINLIFIVILLLLCAPGAFILVRKKLNAEASYTWPDEIRKKWAYMDPVVNARSLPRFTPPKTGVWVSEAMNSLIKSPGLVSLVPTSRFDAIMSEGLDFQLCAHSPTEGNRRLTLLGWNKIHKDIKDQFEFSATTASGKTVRGNIEGLKRLMLHVDIREELRDAGYTNPPPSAVVWIEVQFEGDEPIKSVSMSYREEGKLFADTLDLGPLTSGPSTQPAASVK
jgi:hypothetical protein